MRRSAPLALALSLAAATPAAASDWDGASFAGQRPLSAPALERIAVDFWAQRNIRVCDPTIMRAPRLLASDGVQASGRAWAPSCTVWVQDLWATSAHRDVREELCTLVVHETGHLAGLEHTDSGLMAESPDATPWACKRWASGSASASRRARASERKHGRKLRPRRR
jgi:hypothetical protein